MVHTLTAHDGKRNFGELLLNTQHTQIKISKNGKDTVVVLPIKDFEVIKTDYFKRCVESAKNDLNDNAVVDGESFYAMVLD